jgi:hypothetical protein
MRLLFSASSLCALLCLSHLGLCTPGFPAAIKAHLGMAEPPPCTLCHGSLEGGGPVTTAFGQALQTRGLAAGNNGSLTSALDQLEADGVDSNGNGQTDVADLKAGIDPSLPGDQPLNQAPAQEFGCIGQLAPGSLSGTGAALTGVALCALWWLKRRGGRLR